MRLQCIILINCGVRMRIECLVVFTNLKYDEVLVCHKQLVEVLIRPIPLPRTCLL